MPDNIDVKDATGTVVTLQTTEKGFTDLLAATLKIEGTVTGGAAAAGKPVPVGGKVGLASPPETDGDRIEWRFGASGSGFVNVRDDSAGLTAACVLFTADGVPSTAHGGMVTQARTMVLNSAGDYDRARGDKNGMVTQPYAMSASRFQYAGASGGITNTGDVALAAAGGAGIRNYLTGLQYQNTSAVASEIVIKDGSTVIWRGVASANMTAMANLSFAVPLKGTANTALNVAMITTASATVVSAQGFTGI